MTMTVKLVARSKCVYTRGYYSCGTAVLLYFWLRKNQCIARAARARVSVNFRIFPLHGTRAARAHGFDSPPPSRTLEPLAFDEYCRFDTSAFFLRIKRAESRSIKTAIFIKS